MRTVKVMWDTEAHPKFNRLRFVVQMRKQVAIEKLWPTSFDACVCVTVFSLSLRFPVLIVFVFYIFVWNGSITRVP